MPLGSDWAVQFVWGEAPVRARLGLLMIFMVYGGSSFKLKVSGLNDLECKAV